METETQTTAGNCPVDGQVRPVAEARWYVVSVDGRATLCADEADAKKVEHECNLLYPRHAPHRAMILGDIAEERERCAKACEAEAENWRGDQDVRDFMLCAARIRSGA